MSRRPAPAARPGAAEFAAPSECDAARGPPASKPAPAPAPLAAGRYRLGPRFDARDGLERYHGTLVAADGGETPVVLIREPLPETDRTVPHPPRWPSLAWEDDLTRRVRHVGLPRILDAFGADGFANLVFEWPAGVTLWDAWDDPAAGAAERFGWLARLAELLRALHRPGALLESLSPAQVRITPLGEVVLDPTVCLLPLPVPARAPVRPTLASAPELRQGERVDGRSDLYCFGAVLYALELGHELCELDFHAPGEPKPFLERFPDAHPMLGLLLGKTFHPDRGQRFPTDGSTEDLSGFDELIQALGQAQHTLGRVRLDVAAWSSTGMVRSGNEDAFALVHAAEAHSGAPGEHALVLVADGMGGSAAGEVAATLAVQALRHHLLTDVPFRALSEGPGLPPAAVDRDTIRGRLGLALKEANRRVYLAARESSQRRGMGCTAEAVYLDGRQVVVGHVGDSRTYHLHRGRLEQVTRDQTLVGRLVELGRMTLAEAESHPRRNELSQAIGGRADVEPDFHAAALAPGDWVVVCTDGLTAALRPAAIQEVLERSASAEQAARRLVNRANLAGAADNVTVAVVRAT
jgi:serine/threonine protein phosphatase PrpC